MNRETLVWFLSVFFFVPLLYADSQYECGAHGKFEYCIDGIPGCVIGCHCHPGYYFDTDTKICEPNVKLTQNFRRAYYSEPTRVNIARTNPPEKEQPTTSNAVDEKIDEIAKDADDLGDWLYNQFFKTIENQVINKTQDEKLSPTRRSGKILLKKPVRRSHNYYKSRKKKKKRKSKSLKNKLLRITEDDSIFESDSGSTSNEDETSSSSESSSSVEDIKNEKKYDHGHKKIIIFNKKPLPPLPSFVFLPNMDSPFYPPIGLPPPPVMPMYPMVPVPPIGGPPFPYPGPPTGNKKKKKPSSTTTKKPTQTDGSSDETTTTESSSDERTTTKSTKTQSTTTESTKTESTTTESTTTESTTTDSTTTESTTTEKNSEEKPPKLRQSLKKRKKSTPKNKQDILMTQENRNKLFKKLRAKMNRQNKHENYFGEQYPDAPLDENDIPESVIKQNLLPNMNQMPSPPPNVDFKYLADLIHKADLNKNLASIPNISPGNQKDSINIPVNVPPSRRSYYPISNINDRPVNIVMQGISKMENSNDKFYANLGKQIASMIRKIDSKGEREVNIEIEERNPNSQSQAPVLNEHNSGSRSYWERYVRSPVKYFASFKKEIDHLKKSNEDLFNLENKFEFLASTAPTLSLHDLENIINNVQRMPKPKRNKKVDSEKKYISNASFKLNLLPVNVKSAQSNQLSKQKQSFEKFDLDTSIIHEKNTRRKQPNADRLLFSNFQQYKPDYDLPLPNSGLPIDETVSTQSMKPTRIPSDDNLSPKLYNTNMMPSFIEGKGNKTHFKIKYQLSPVLLNHRSLNYKPHNKYPNLFENAMPLPYPSLTNNFVADKPSYFHHEFHHFDYFDE